MSIKIFRKLGVQKAWEYRAEPESQQLLTTVFWRMMLLIAFLVLLIALWFGYQELNAASQAENVAQRPDAAQQPWTPAQLQSALDSFSAKQSSYQSLASSSLPAVADPSK